MLSGAKLKYDQKYHKKGVEVMGLGQWGKKIKIVLRCLAWQQIKAVDYPNHLNMFKNLIIVLQNSLIVLPKGSILGSERSNG